MPRRRSTGTSTLSRRRFVKLLAAGSAAALAAPAIAFGADATTAKPPATKPAAASAAPSTTAPSSNAPASLRAEVEKQKKALADQLKVIRDYHLPPGSNMAFVFQPMRRKGRTP
jgi:flagellar motility protein MotE (MotC chaperone)